MGWKEEGKYVICFLVYLAFYRGSRIVDFISFHLNAKICVLV